VTVWKRIQHPNILPLLGFRAGAEPCLVSPWRPKGNLLEYTEAHPELSVIQRLILLRQAGRGLAHLHTLVPPICHGDIKPTNVLVTSPEEAEICDFGLARVVGALNTGLTTSGQGQGSRGFEAPELLDVDGHQSLAADVFAFAGLVLSTLSGKPPFHEYPSRARVVLAVAAGKIPVPASHTRLPANDPLWNLMRRCWAFEPNARPAMTDVVAELDREISKRQIT